jgi:glutathione S-transferase
MLTIWGRANSVNVQKVLWTCDELQIAYERIDAGRGFSDTNTQEYRRLNPNGLIPTIVDGDFILWESNVIVRYLAASYGDAQFYPADLHSRFLCEQWMDWNATTLWPAVRPIFQLLVRTTPDKRDLSPLGTLQSQADATMRILDEQLREREFVGGKNFTMADIPVGVSAHRWLNLDIERSELPALKRWYEDISKRPAFRSHVTKPLT